MVQMYVYKVVVDMNQGQAVVLLADEPVERLLPIWIGIFEARAIMMELQGETPPRPYTHDLLNNLIGALGYQLERISVVELRDSTFYALLELIKGEQSVEMDARPSDSLALALRAGAPILVAEEVLAQAEIRPQDVEHEDDVDRFADLMKKVDFRSGGGGDEGAPSGEPPDSPPSPEPES